MHLKSEVSRGNSINDGESLSNCAGTVQGKDKD